MWVDCSDGVQIGAEVRLSDTGQLQLIDDEGKVRSAADGEQLLLTL